ncbi:spore germination protein [Desulfosporosinus nitroreducens]|uniref:spore germination protein n=1 Tax=Desulfosporosinus nitroreducens TaxID=2018668 RepID=UPI00207C274D|nr:spore germination protein [Desulfosporosinus nitroreducens]MCO1604605.1 spore germination protein [Desulfosporosinus nitroreducens]
MLRSILKKIHFWQALNQTIKRQGDNSQELSPSNLSDNIQENLKHLQTILGTSSDIVVREFNFGYEGKIEAAIIYLTGMTSSAIVNDSIIKPLMYDTRLFSSNELLVTNNIELIQKTMLSVGGVKRVSTIELLIDGCLYGDTVLLVNGSQEALVISTVGWEARSVEEPKTEGVVRGPREGFTETLGTNTALLRRKIRNPNFTFETMQIGQKTKTGVRIAYLKELVNPRLVEEVKRRLKRINTDAILESGYIEQYIEDAPFSPFQTVGNCEKPDVVAAKLLEGRVAILVDGTPMVLTIPLFFIESFQSAEDYYSRPYYASMVRSLRYLAFLITILAPAAYVALTNFHQEMIPTPLLFTMAAAKEGTPFPAVTEALGMGLIFEILREAGVRLPRPVGSAITIVGALVIGESAVSAGLIGAPMVIVVGITAISSFVVPPQADAGAILRLLFTIFAGFLGAFGMMIVLLGILIHLSSLRSFGTPYLSPLAPLSLEGLKDTFIRVPLWAMFTRPRIFSGHDPQKQEFRLMPEPPSEDSENR